MVELQYLHNNILMNVRYICSSKMLIIVSPGWSLKFTETSGLHSLRTKTFGSITCRKPLTHPASCLWTCTKQSYLLISEKRIGWPINNRSSVLPDLSTASFQNSQNNQFPMIFCCGSVFINCNDTPCSTSPLTEDCPTADMKMYLWQHCSGTWCQ